MAGYKAPLSVAVVMAGGTGTRFWPLSVPERPKQFLSLIGDHPLIVQTVTRARSCVSDPNVVICSAASQEQLLRTHFSSDVTLVIEPEGKNTAACLMLSLVSLLRKGYADDTVMVVMPADHYIEDLDSFQTSMKKAIATAHESHRLVTLGIVPRLPHTGYGYIEAESTPSPSGALDVVRFIEKPDRGKAEGFLRKGNFFWNSGMFAWELSALRSAFEKHLPESWNKISSHKTKEELSAIYKKLPAVAIDTAVLEKADNLSVIPADFDWSDIGSWDAVHALKCENQRETVTLSGTTTSIESKGCLVHVPPQKRVALVGVEDLIVVENGDTILVASRAKDQLVKDAVKAIHDSFPDRNTTR